LQKRDGKGKWASPHCPIFIYRHELLRTCLLFAKLERDLTLHLNSLQNSIELRIFMSLLHKERRGVQHTTPNTPVSSKSLGLQFQWEGEEDKGRASSEDPRLKFLKQSKLGLAFVRMKFPPKEERDMEMKGSLPYLYKYFCIFVSKEKRQKRRQTWRIRWSGAETDGETFRFLRGTPQHSLLSRILHANNSEIIWVRPLPKHTLIYESLASVLVEIATKENWSRWINSTKLQLH